jgi:peptide/nickel transport system substrate-binding protein
VRIKLKTLNPTLLSDMSTFFPIVPKDYAEKAGPEGFAAAPVGTGPFKLVSRAVQAGFKLETNDGYWGDRPKIDGVDVRVVPDDSTRVAMLMAGEADVVQNLPSFMIQQIDADPNLDALVLPAIQEQFFLYNPQSRVWDLKVRQAIAKAVDVQTIAQTLFHGSTSPLPGFCLPERELGCDGSLKAVAFDPEGAKKLLEEAGFDFSQPLKLLGLAPGGAPNSKETVEAVASYLGNIGVKTEVILMESGALRAFRAQEVKDYSKHDLLFYAYAALNSDPTQKLTFMKTGGAGSFHSMPEYDAMMDAIAQEANADARTALISKALKYIDDQAYVLNLWNTDAVYGKKAEISWAPPPDVIMPVFATLERKASN